MLCNYHLIELIKGSFMSNKELIMKSLFSTIMFLSLSYGAVASDKKEEGNSNRYTNPQRDSVVKAKSNQYFWPDQIDLSVLRDHDVRSNPLGEDFDYKKAFNQLDLDALKKDIDKTLTQSQEWWPADWGNYGPFFIRMAWHAAGTYRVYDGRGGAGGGQQRFDPLNSWPDNASLDKARRLLWPVKQKYGENISWADLLILAGNVSLENMGFKTYGFAGGREDEWEPDIVYWGPELEMLSSNRHETNGELQKPLAATHMGLIYVNPEGPKGNPDPVAAANDIRVAFGRMAMNDEETVALIAGGHSFGKMHGAHKAADCVGNEPASAAIEDQGLGWKNQCAKGHSEDTVTSGLEGAWTQSPTKWSTLYLSNLLSLDWKQTKSPAGAIQWIPVDEDMHESVPDAHVKDKYNPPVMTTADLAVKFDPEYLKIAQRFLDNPDEYQKAFAKAWYKLTHRDMGPRANYLGKEVPSEDLIWQDTIPQARKDQITPSEINELKQEILDSGLTVPQLVTVAWGAASSYRSSDMRGGANGARIALAPQIDWPVNNPKELGKVLAKLKDIQTKFNKGGLFSSGNKISLADMIVLAGSAAIEKAAADADIRIKVPFVPGREDASQSQTDIESFAVLEPTADAFRNYYSKDSLMSPVDALIDKADQLDLTVPQMTVLIGGMRALGANSDGSKNGVFTDKVGTLTNDFFVNLLDMSTIWNKSSQDGLYEGIERKTGKVKYTATSVDLIFGSSSELRAVAEVYAFNNSKERFVKDFVDAWVKVMQLDRFDLK
jgi:catalase-peroxidase